AAEQPLLIAKTDRAVLVVVEVGKRTVEGQHRLLERLHRSRARPLNDGLEAEGRLLRCRLGEGRSAQQWQAAAQKPGEGRSHERSAIHSVPAPGTGVAGPLSRSPGRLKGQTGK